MQKILFITLSNIGDVVMTTPVLEALHLAYPHAIIDVMGDARSEILFRDCPFIHTFFRKPKKVGIKQAYDFIQTVRQTYYDLAVDLRTDGLLYLLCAKHKLHKLSNRKLMHMHSVEKHFATIKTFLPSIAMPCTKLYLADKDKASAQLFLKTHGLAGKRILALGLGANFAGKIWPVSAFVGLAKALSEHFDVVLLFGNQQESILAAEFIANYQGLVVDASGQFDLMQTTALLANARYFVGNDSGLGHLASAVKVPSFTVFGVGQPHRYRPWGQTARWFQDEGHEIKHVDSETIAQQVQAHLKTLN
jgi:heptosyltransferase-3